MLANLRRASNFAGFSQRQFQEFCILCGCDFIKRQVGEVGADLWAGGRSTVRVCALRCKHTVLSPDRRTLLQSA